MRPATSAAMVSLLYNHTSPPSSAQSAADVAQWLMHVLTVLPPLPPYDRVMLPSPYMRFTPHLLTPTLESIALHLVCSSVSLAERATRSLAV